MWSIRCNEASRIAAKCAPEATPTALTTSKAGTTPRQGGNPETMKRRSRRVRELAPIALSRRFAQDSLFSLVCGQPVDQVVGCKGAHFFA